MKLLNNMTQIRDLVKWQEGGKTRLLKLKFSSESEQMKIEVSDTSTNEKQVVENVSEITISQKKNERTRERNIEKIMKKLNGSFIPFINWVKEKENREVHFIVGEGVDMDAVKFFVFDNDLEVGQTVDFIQQIDLLSERILFLMYKIIEEKDEKKKREYSLEIVDLEIKKLKV